MGRRGVGTQRCSSFAADAHCATLPSLPHCSSFPHRLRPSVHSAPLFIRPLFIQLTVHPPVVLVTYSNDPVRSQ
jgi:hypothetical protein